MISGFESRHARASPIRGRIIYHDKQIVAFTILLWNSGHLDLCGTLRYHGREEWCDYVSGKRIVPFFSRAYASRNITIPCAAESLLAHIVDRAFEGHEAPKKSPAQRAKAGYRFYCVTPTHIAAPPHVYHWSAG